MATTIKNNVVRLTADNDTFGQIGMGKIKIRGCRLIAGSDAATAQIKILNTDGVVLMSLKAAANAADESQICFTVDGGIVHVDMTGTSPEVFIYLE